MGDIDSRLAKLSPEKRALLEKRLRENTTSVAPASGAEPLAIIGIGCRFPGGTNSPEALWRLVAQGGDAITEVPPERWSLEELYDPDPVAAGKTSTRWGGFIDGVDAFDASLFGIAPREAAQMDPQQRILLETAWDALEHAGQAPDRLKGTETGVFVGVHSHSIDYCLMQYADPTSLDAFSSTGTAHNFLSGRLSYLFDLRGPSLAVDTACSSSLVAVHLACQSLRAGESTMAIVAGVNLMLTPAFTVAASRMHMLSPDGRCKAFDARANGFVRSEGCGVVVLKRLSQALSDGDRVIAVIRGSAVNQDGHTNGITAPNGLSQQAVIREALRQGGVDPSQVGYVEAHGTGTPLGDPIEVEALTAVFGRRAPGSPVALGSVKSSIGHLEGAAGIAGLIKAVLCLQHKQWPPVAHFREINPHISISGTAVVIPQSLTPWETQRGRRVAGVSSFGWSGTNAHVVLEEAPEMATRERTPGGGRLLLLPVSARTDEAFAAQIHGWRQWCEAGINSTAALEDVCNSATLRRAHHDHRAAVIGESVKEIADLLGVVASERTHPRVAVGRRGERAGIVFVFPGQGSQWLGMGRHLLDGEPVFRAAIERCSKALSVYVDWSLVDELRAAPDASRLREIDVVQPVLFSIEVALAGLWRSWGITPDAVVGHSMGEVAAAHVAGALTLEDAARVICLRSQLLRRISGQGAMAALELSYEEAARAIAGYEECLSIAVSNSPGSTVISGDVAAIDAVMATLQSRDVFCRAINVDVASHSPHVDALQDDLLKALAPVKPGETVVPMYSTVTAAIASGQELDAWYWARNLRQPVQMSAAVQRLVADGNSTFMEMSPHPILLPAIEDGLSVLGVAGIALPSLRRDEDERGVLLGAVASLYVNGYDPDWRSINGSGAFIDVPHYPFQRERFWLARDDTRSPEPVARRGHPVLGEPLERSDRSYVWDVVTRGAFLPARESCTFDGTPLVAPALWCESALEAAAVAGASGVSDFELLLAFVPTSTVEVTSRAEAIPSAGGVFKFRLLSRQHEQPWTTHAIGTLSRLPRTPLVLDRDDALTRSATHLTRELAYERLAESGWRVGDPLRAMSEVHLGSRDLVARFETPTTRRHPSFRLPLALWQSCFDAASLLASATTNSAPADAYLPLRVGDVRLGDVSATSGWIVARVADDHRGTVDVSVVDDSGASVVTLRAVEMIHHSASARDLVTASVDNWLFDLSWEAIGHAIPAHASREPLSWLIFADRAGVGGSMAAAVVQRGDAVTLVRRDDPRDVGEVVREYVAAAAGRRCAVVHLWSLDLPGLESTSQDDLEDTLVHNCGSILHSVQALVESLHAVQARLWLVTKGAHTISRGVNDQGPMQAPVWGLGRVVAEEHHEHWGGLVDIDPSASVGESASTLVDQILSDESERQVAFRDGVRYGARFTAARHQIPSRQQVCLRPDASYVITGGFTGVGAATAKWMIEHGARRLVLIGRTPLPPRTDWLSAEVSSSVGQRIAVVRELEALGAQVRVETFDVSDEKALTDFWHMYHAEGWPSVRGIIHAAAVIEDGLLRNLDARSFNAVMRPKVTGAWLLHRLTKAEDLDFFVMFSSLGAVLGQTGQGNYGAANAFMDGLAHYRRELGLPATSINWAGWREAGLGATSVGARQTIQNLDAEGVASYTTAQGLDLFAHILARAPAQSVVIPMSRSRFRQSHWAASEPKLFSKVLTGPIDALSESARPTPAFRVRLVDTAPAERRAVFEQFLAEQLAQVLRLPVSRIDPARPMGSLGLESLMALEFRNRLEAQLGLKLSATIVWNHPTVAALARHLARRMEITLTTDMSAAEVEPSETAQSAAIVTADLDALSDLDALRVLAGDSSEVPR
jgi:myxalamid-type polyketide synthase MxaE and MxaD